MEPVVFTPRIKPPTLIRVWIPFLVISIFSLLLSLLTKNPFGVFCFSEVIWFTAFLFSRWEIKVLISTENKTFEYYYMDCWGEERIIVIDITTAAGSYKYVKIDRSKFGWQLIFQNDKHNKVKILQGSFKKFQLDQMVRMINQIKKGIFVADVGNEFQVNRFLLI